MKKLTFIFLFGALSLGAFAQQASEEVRYNQYGVKVSRTPLFPESRDGILVFESANQDYRFWFDVRVQLDGAVFFGEKGYMNPIGNNVTNRRTRLGVKAQITKHWQGEIDTDFANGQFELKDALLRYSVCGWSFTAGNFKEDFSMEQTTSSRYLPFMERPMVVQTFSPSRHLGVNVKFQKDWFYASLGTAFQVLDNTETLGWVEDANKDFGQDQGVSFTGKLIFHPFYKSTTQGIHIGLGASYRTPKTDMDPEDGGQGFARYSTRNNTAINRKKYLDTDAIPGVDYELLYNFELAAYHKGLRLQGEYIGNNTYIRDNAGPAINKDTKVFGGWYAMAGIMLFGGQQRYNVNEGEFTQPSRGRSWGDLEFLLRYDYLDLNTKNIYGGSGQNFTAGLNYYVNNSVKFVLNYQYVDNDRYANGKGKLNVGYNANGVATPNYAEIVAKKGKGGVKYHMIGMRMEIDF